MKRTMLAGCFISLLYFGGFAQTAAIKIDVDRVISDIDPKITQTR